jgi:hypothetical protein
VIRVWDIQGEDVHGNVSKKNIVLILTLKEEELLME